MTDARARFACTGPRSVKRLSSAAIARRSSLSMPMLWSARRFQVQMTFGLTQCRVAQPSLRSTIPKVNIEAIGERLSRARLGISLLPCRIAAELRLRMQLFSLPAGRRDAHGRMGAERQTTGAAADGVLVDPRALAAFADAQTPTGDVIVEPDFVALTGCQSESIGRFDRELHWVSWEQDGKIEAVSQVGQAWPEHRWCLMESNDLQGGSRQGWPHLAGRHQSVEQEVGGSSPPNCTTTEISPVVSATY